MMPQINILRVGRDKPFFDRKDLPCTQLLSQNRSGGEPGKGSLQQTFVYIGIKTITNNGIAWQKRRRMLVLLLRFS